MSTSSATLDVTSETLETVDARTKELGISTYSTTPNESEDDPFTEFIWNTGAKKFKCSLETGPNEMYFDTKVMQ